jgi:trimethylamine:corrinoid methyltransferase-like protein
MTSDFLYPAIGDRRSIGEWQDDGRPDSWQRAHDRVKERLAATPRQLVDPALAARIESRFAVRSLTQALPRDLTSDEVSDVG